MQKKFGSRTVTRQKKPVRQPLAALIATLCFGLPATVTRAADDPVFALGEVKVTASPDSDEALASTSIDLEDMRANQRNTVGSALEMAPGVNASRFGARNEQTVYVRGFDSRQVPLYVDGIPVYVPYDGYVDLARFTTFDLSRIEVAKGFSSMVYGANTLGGAINLISRRPVKAFEGEVGGGLNFDNTGANNAYHTYTNLGTNQGMWYAQFSTAYADQDYYRLPDDFAAKPGEDGGKRNNSYSSDRKINLKLGLTPNATDEYAINYINQHGTKGNPPYAGSRPIGPSNPLRYWQWRYWDKESLYLLTNTAIGEHRIKFRAYHDTFQNSLFAYDDASYTTQKLKSAFQSWYDDYTNGFSIEGDFRLAASNQLKAAYHFKEDVHREHNLGEPIRHFRDQTQSFGLEDSQRLSERLSLVTGLGYDIRESKEAQDYQSGKVFDFKRADNDAFNAQAGLLFKTSDSGRLTASIAQKSRFPTIKERYSYKMGTGIPNPDLKTEEALHYELGYSERLAPGLIGEARAFYSDIHNLIQSAVIAPGACSKPPCTQSQNVTKVAASGYELSLRGAVLRNVDTMIAYNYLDRRNLSGDGIYLTDTPHHNLFAAIDWRPTGGLTLGASALGMTRRYSSSDGKQVAPEFITANLKAGYRFANGLNVEAGVTNVFDKLYSISEGYPEAGRTFFTSFNLPL